MYHGYSAPMIEHGILWVMKKHSGHDRHERRIFIILLILLFISVGNVFTKLTVHDAEGLNAAQQRCGREGVRREFARRPLMRVLIRFGDISVMQGDAPDVSEVRLYTLWRIPVGTYRNGIFVPKGMAFSCTWADQTTAQDAQPGDGGSKNP